MSRNFLSWRNFKEHKRNITIYSTEENQLLEIRMNDKRIMPKIFIIATTSFLPNVVSVVLK